MKKIAGLIIILFLGGLIFIRTSKQKPVTQTGENTPKANQTQSPEIVSTKPDPLENNIIGADQTIDITFNLPIQNVGEFKTRIEPQADYKIQLSGDRKTAEIIPQKPYELGMTYTLFIGTDTKFDGVGAWGQEKIFHFQTIKYNGV